MNTHALNADPHAAARAAALWAYIHERSARFSTQDAADVIQDVSAYLGEPPKKLARKLRYALAERGIPIKHASALHAAARILNLGNWENARRLQVASSSEPLEVSIWPNLESQVCAGWRTALEVVEEACTTWLAAHPLSKVVDINAGAGILQFRGLLFEVKDGIPSRQPSPDPIAFIRPADEGRQNWMAGAVPQLESLRRRLEETGRAVLDCYAILRLCDTDTDAADGKAITLGDAVNSELVVLREDHPGSGGFEIMRGSELACWHQLEQALDDVTSGGMVVDEGDGAWRFGPARFVWEIAALRPGDSTPSLHRRRVDVRESKNLLHRYRKVRALLSTAVPFQEAARHLDTLSSLPATCSLHKRNVETALAAVDLTWEGFCAEQGHTPLPLEQPVPMDLLLALATRLASTSPYTLIAPPPRDRLVRADDDQLLRALMPRTHWVRYRIAARLEAHRAEGVKDAVDDFSASLHLRQGEFRMKDALPQLVYSEDAADLLGRLADDRLAVYVGVMPHIARMTDEQISVLKQHHDRLLARAAAGNWQITLPELAPFYFGYALFLDIDHAPGA